MPARRWSSPRSACCSGGRADSGAVRTGAEAGAGRGRRPRRRPGRRSPTRSRRPAARSRTTASCWPATSRPRAARGPSSAAPRCRSPRWPRWPSRWSRCTASPTSTGCCRPRAQREALDRFGGAPLAALLATYADLHRAPRGRRARARRGGGHRPRAGPGGRPAPLRPRRDRGGRPEPGEDATLAAEESRLGLRRHPAHRGRAGPRGALQRAGRPGRAGDRLGGPHALLDGVREHDPEAGELADRLAEITYLLSDVAADVASYAARIDTDPARLAAVSERRAALTALTRKYGETIDEVLAWAEQSATRLLDLDGTDERIEELRAEQRGAARRARARRPQRCRRPAPRPPAGSAAEVTAELALLAMPHARLDASTVRDAAPSRLRRRVPAPDDESSCCWPPTPAPSRGRCTRARPAASCPG